MKNKMQKLLMSAAVASVVAVAIQACTDGNGGTRTIPRTTEAIPVRVMSLTPASTHAVTKASGHFTTDDETVLGFKTGGIVSRVFVREGDAIRKGQLLATLDLTEINTAVAQAHIAADKAQRDLRRARNLHADSVATLEQLQNAETAVAVAEQQLEAATFNLSFSEIHAPANGFVLRKFVNAGQVVSVGDPVLLTNAVSQRGWVLKVGVSDRQWSSIHMGDEAKVIVDAFPGETLRASVIRKSETADAATGAFTIELAVQHKDLRLATGMFGAAEFTAPEAQQGWAIPHEAVLDANGSEGFVFVTSDGNTAHKQSVVIDAFTGSHVLVSSGLEASQSLIVSGSAYLTDSSSIRIIK